VIGNDKLDVKVAVELAVVIEAFVLTQDMRLL